MIYELTDTSIVKPLFEACIKRKKAYGKHYTRLTEYLWPIVREMIKTAIEKQQN